MPFGSKIHRTLYVNVLLITSSGVQAGGHLLTLFGLGFLPTKKDWEGGGGQNSLTSQMTMKLAKDIL